MGKKEKCREIMGNLFGSATAEWVDMLKEDEVVDKCRAKVTALFDAEKAKIFDGI